MIETDLEQTTKILRLFLHSQAIIHCIDDLHDSVIYKHQFKKEMNRTLRFLEPKLDNLLRNADVSESQYYVDIVSELEKVTKEINVELK